MLQQQAEVCRTVAETLTAGETAAAGGADGCFA